MEQTVIQHHETRGESQKKKVLTWLKEVGPITPLEALRLFGAFRLAAIIHELRNSGHIIRTDIVEKDEKRYARYTYVGLKSQLKLYSNEK